MGIGSRVAARARALRGPRSRPLVLLYHGFTDARRDDDPENLFVEAAAFEQQLDHLLARGWTPLDLDGYVAACRNGAGSRRSFLVTIDDALESVASIAAPALSARKIPAVLYVPAGLMGRTATWLPAPKDEPLLDEEALRDLTREHDIELGGHGWEHTAMAGLDPHQLHRETVQVRERLCEVVGGEIRSFAYPFGIYDAAATEAVADAGYQCGFSVHHDGGPMAISRVDVNATDTLGTMRLKTVPGYSRLWRALEFARPVRRAIRRTASRRGRATP
jgi:peptidoglycan/xylan/chitin deacetylase (PgdA/CDA1 family)